MRAASILVIIAVLAAVGWYFRDTFLSPKATQEPAQTTIAGATPDETTLPAPEPLTEEEVEQALEVEAEAFIETLTETDPEPVGVEEADHFVRADQSISLLAPETIEPSTAAEVLADASLSPDSPITLVKEIEQVEVISPARLIADSGGDLEQTIVVLAGGKRVETTVREALQTHASNPDQPISVVKKVRHYQITTPKEFEEGLDQTVQGEALIGVIKKPYRLEAATIAEILIEEQILDEESIYYVRTVRPGDEQGIWGIVQGGLISNFARGVAIGRGEEMNTYQVEIPQLADEVLADHSSSYLGRLIHTKTLNTYVYNYKENRMGKNPDSLFPGQEIVIVKFSPDELIEIYKHFVKSDG